MQTQTFELNICVNKSDSAFVYFILEANEGVCHYSTLDYEEGHPWREIEIRGSNTYLNALKQIIEQLNKSIHFHHLKWSDSQL